MLRYVLAGACSRNSSLWTWNAFYHKIWAEQDCKDVSPLGVNSVLPVHWLCVRIPHRRTPLFYALCTRTDVEHRALLDSAIPVNISAWMISHRDYICMGVHLKNTNDC